MKMIKSRIDKTGRLVIPNHYRHALELKPGEEVMIRLENGEIHVYSFKKAAQKARDLISDFNTENIDLLEILFKERREEAVHD